ncbi:hypothetical protein L596_016819 [Steinernema carpocapsae]|uniref:UPAR/Ly6 domain-containing protein n=1 Tax=Steinernema carpocapsae TaxID=34508 RepID=A0A4U5NKD5_STECR|nr:hypothetical protein L596_016819 [Steinernema carpocapsae]
MDFLLSLLVFFFLLTQASCNNVTNCYKEIIPGNFTYYVGSQRTALVKTTCSLPNEYCIVLTDYKTLLYLDCLSALQAVVEGDPDQYDHNNINCMRDGCTDSVSDFILSGQKVTYCCYGENMGNWFQLNSGFKASISVFLALYLLISF